MLKPKKSVEKMTGYYVPMFEQDWDIKIDSNENNYGPSPKVMETLKNCGVKNISFYPFYGELTQKIADFYSVDFDNIKVTNGADEALQGIIQTYLEPDETLLTLDVSFDMPVIYASIQGGNIVKVPFEEKWVFPCEKFLNKIEDETVKIIYVATPNNPTGNIVEKDTIIKIVEKAKDKVVIIDETYSNYAKITYKDLVKDYDNVFIVRSFSKDFALAGMRLGAVISSCNNINNLKKVISPFSVNSLAMIAGIKALEDSQYFENIREEIISSREELKEFFESLGATVYSSFANFLLVDFKKKAEFVYNLLKKENISVKLFKKGSLLENHLRVTVPTKQGVKKIKKALVPKISLVFDMDGVLIDARNSYRVAIEKTYEHFSGEKISQQEIQTAKNRGGLNNDWDLTKYLLDKKGCSVEYRDIVDVFQKLYWNDGNGLIQKENALFDKDILEKLSEKYNLSVFTGRLKKEAMYALEKFGVKDLFSPIITTDDIPEGMGKPSPYGLNLVKDLTYAEKYYYFGDTSDDMKSASGAGYVGVGVLPPQDKTPELISQLKKEGANQVITSVNEIEKVLEKKDEAIL